MVEKYLKKNYDPTKKKTKKKQQKNKKKTNISTKKNLIYVATYNKNNPDLFTEIITNLELKIEEVLDTTKVIKSQR